MNHTRNPKVDKVLKSDSRWAAEVDLLRDICLEAGLKEELKWYQACYSHKGKNVAIIGEFKDHCALGFFKGELLDDPEGLLVGRGPNTQSAKYMPWTGVTQISKHRTHILQYIFAAMKNEEDGKKVQFKKVEEYQRPVELDQRMEADPEFKQAFEALTPGRQKGYIIYFSSAKQAKTRESRIERAYEKIKEGKGWNER